MDDARSLTVTAPAVRGPLIAALLATTVSVLTLGYALAHQLAFTDGTEQQYVRWTTRPLTLWAAGAVLVGLLAVAVARPTRSRRVPLTLVVVSVSALVVGGVSESARTHPDGHERALAGQLVLPADYVVADYRPATRTVLGEANPPTLVRTWTAAADPELTCGAVRTALNRSGLRMLPEAPGGPGLACVWLGSVGGWPVLVEVDEPGGAGSEVPGPGREVQPASVPAGLVRVDVYVQPPDGAGGPRRV
jgi:hypothetical protein